METVHCVQDNGLRGEWCTGRCFITPKMAFHRDLWWKKPAEKGPCRPGLVCHRLLVRALATRERHMLETTSIYIHPSNGVRYNMFFPLRACLSMGWCGL